MMDGCIHGKIDLSCRKAVLLKIRIYVLYELCVFSFIYTFSSYKLFLTAYDSATY